MLLSSALPSDIPMSGELPGVGVPAGDFGAIQNSSIRGADLVLRRLCDDTYVPTQPWPVRWEVNVS